MMIERSRAGAVRVQVAGVEPTTAPKLNPEAVDGSAAMPQVVGPGQTH